MRDKALVVRSAAVGVLSRSLSPAIREVFWQELYKQFSDSTMWVREQILQALAQQPQENEGKFFERLLSEKGGEYSNCEYVGFGTALWIKITAKTETPVVQKMGLWQKHLRKNSSSRT